MGRELYSEVNRRFAVHCQQTRGLEVQMTLSFGATTQQAERIIAGSPIDVVCFNQVTDIDALVAAGLVAKDWDRRLAHRASPYFSTMAFLVRKGNPKQIRDWSDLAREDVSLVFPDPKTSGTAATPTLRPGSSRRTDSAATKRRLGRSWNGCCRGPRSILRAAEGRRSCSWNGARGMF